MQNQLMRRARRRRAGAFTLVEMLVVIAIISILMTAGSIGLSGMGGKGVTSGVATAESLFDEARSTAMGRNIRTAVLVAKELDDDPAGNFRKIVVASEEVDQDGNPRNPGDNPDWVISSRGSTLGDNVFFSPKFSQKDHMSGGGQLDEATIDIRKPKFDGTYFIYEFNGEGISKNPGASFVIGSGARGQDFDNPQPTVTASSKRDFGGFVIWRNGSTSVFRSPEQISSEIMSLKPGDTF